MSLFLPGTTGQQQQPQQASDYQRDPQLSRPPVDPAMMLRSFPGASGRTNADLDQFAAGGVAPMDQDVSARPPQTWLSE